MFTRDAFFEKEIKHIYSLKLCDSMTNADDRLYNTKAPMWSLSHEQLKAIMFSGHKTLCHSRAQPVAIFLGERIEAAFSGACACVYTGDHYRECSEIF